MLRRAAEIYQAEGMFGVWFGFLARTVYRRLELVELDLGRPPPLAEASIPLEFGFLREEELSSYAELGASADGDEARRRMAAGDRCFVAWSQGGIVSARWIAECRGYIAYLTRWLELDGDEVYLSETYTHPSQRGSGVSAAAGTRLAHVLAAEGRRRILAAVLPENRAGRRAYEKAGYKSMGRIGCVKLGPWRRDFLRSKGQSDAP